MSVNPPVATFKELCADVWEGAEDVGSFGRFWAAASGLELRRSGPDYPGDLVGREEGQGIALCPVPEEPAAKNRVHLDVSVGSLAELTDLGARIVRPEYDEIRWTIMADPEGGEFCAFVRSPERLTPYRVFEFNVDCVDAEATARWWAEVFGVEARREADNPWWWLEGVPGFPSRDVAPSFSMIFCDVPEPKTVKNRWHWDVYGDVADLLARGATELWAMPRWTVLADPEGNEFCVFPR